MHRQVIGAPRKGKTKYLEHLIRGNLASRKPFVLLDPHGGLYQDILATCAQYRYPRPFLIDPRFETPFNPFHDHDSLLEAFQYVWGEDTRQTPLLRRVLRLLLFILVTQKKSLQDILRLLVSRTPLPLSDPVLSEQWGELIALPDRQYHDTVGSTVNRLSEFLTSKIRDLFSHTAPLIPLDRPTLVNLYGIPDAAARLAGTIILHDIFHRIRSSPTPLDVYVDECHLFMSPLFDRMLVEAPKYGLRLTIAHQTLAQLGDRLDSVLTACEHVIFGGLPYRDAVRLCEEVYAGHISLDEPKEHTFRSFRVGDYEIDRSSVTTNADGDIVYTGISTSVQGVYEDLPTQWYSLSEQVYKRASYLRRLPPRQAVVDGPALFIVPEIPTLFIRRERVDGYADLKPWPIHQPKEEPTQFWSAIDEPIPSLNASLPSLKTPSGTSPRRSSSTSTTSGGSATSRRRSSSKRRGTKNPPRTTD